MGNTKLMGLIIACIGIIGAAVGYLMYYDAKHGFTSKRFDAALALGAIFLIAGVALAVRPSKA